MIHLTCSSNILIATQPADFRQGIDGLAALCKQRLNCRPRSGTLFVFINRNKTMVRALVYENNGFWLMTKRLSKVKFSGWPTVNNAITPLDATHFRKLLSGHYTPLK
jgi:transposase